MSHHMTHEVNGINKSVSFKKSKYYGSFIQDMSYHGSRLDDKIKLEKLFFKKEKFEKLSLTFI